MNDDIVKKKIEICFLRGKKSKASFSAFPDLKRISTGVSPLKGILIPNRK